jgi:hypothetical protein
MKRALVNLAALAVSLASAVSLAQDAAPQHPQGIEKVPMGVVSGGWGYVYASYGVALGGLLLYAVSLWTRRPSAQQPQGDLP